jgi:hypothetical protein
MKLFLPDKVINEIKKFSRDISVKRRLADEKPQHEGDRLFIINETIFSAVDLSEQLEEFIKGSSDIEYEEAKKKDLNEREINKGQKFKDLLLKSYSDKKVDGKIKGIHDRTLEWALLNKGKDKEEGATEHLSDLLCCFVFNNRDLNGTLTFLNIDTSKAELIMQYQQIREARKIENARKALEESEIHLPIKTIRKVNNANEVEDSQHALTKYYRYLENVCGKIKIEGLNKEVAIEDYCIPLAMKEFDNSEIKENPISVLLLGGPGSGKSTMLKSLVIRYIFPEKAKKLFIGKFAEEGSDEIELIDGLFPIYIRCRDFRRIITAPFMDIICDIPKIAAIPEIMESFRLLIYEYLSKGNILLLIDGLDEISEESDRKIFVENLKMFLTTYSSVKITVSSRYIDNSIQLSDFCKYYSIAPLSKTQVEAICTNWFKAVGNSKREAEEEAKRIANIIFRDPSLSDLGENPLLLTALLLVKKRKNYLPSDKLLLYAETIEMLVEEWNVEGHGYDQLDYDETEFQLAYIAHWMSIRKLQVICKEDLKQCLKIVRTQIDRKLDYSPNEFIKRVEKRSGILIKSGRLSYEFVHSNFQQYLTAVSIKKKYFLKDENSNNNLFEILLSNLLEGWMNFELIIGVLPKKEITILVEFLITQCKSITKKEIQLFLDVYLIKKDQKLFNYFLDAHFEYIKFNFKYHPVRHDRMPDDKEELEKIEKSLESITSRIINISESKTGELVTLKKFYSVVMLGSLLLNEIDLDEKLNDVIEWFSKYYLFAFYINVSQIFEGKYGNVFTERVKYIFFNKSENAFAYSLIEILNKSIIHGLESKNGINLDTLFQEVRKDLSSRDFKKNYMGFLKLLNILIKYYSGTIKITKALEKDFISTMKEYLKYFIATRHPQDQYYRIIAQYFSIRYPEYCYLLKI